jgi:hypothetical protein
MLTILCPPALSFPSYLTLHLSYSFFTSTSFCLSSLPPLSLPSLPYSSSQVAARLIKPGNTNAMVTAAVKKVPNHTPSLSLSLSLSLSFSIFLYISLALTHALFLSPLSLFHSVFFSLFILIKISNNFCSFSGTNVQVAEAYGVKPMGGTLMHQMKR